jgi:hypothetical protein
MIERMNPDTQPIPEETPRDTRSRLHRRPQDSSDVALEPVLVKRL